MKGVYCDSCGIRLELDVSLCDDCAAEHVERWEQPSLSSEPFFSPSQVHSGSITPRDTSKPVEVLRTKAGVL